MGQEERLNRYCRERPTGGRCGWGVGPGEGGSAPAHERARDAQWGSSGLPLRAVGASKDFSPAENRSSGNRIALAASVQRMGFKQLFSKHGLGTPRVPLPGNPRGQTIFIIILRTHLTFQSHSFVSLQWSFSAVTWPV